MGKGEPTGPTGAILGIPSPSRSTDVNPGGQRKSRIEENRSCQDILFLIVFVAFWVGMIINSSYGINKGDPRRLIYGLDYKGNVCGDSKAHPNLKDYKVRYWMNPNQVYDAGDLDNPFNLVDARSICLGGCPTPASNGTLSWVCDYPEGSISSLSTGDWRARNYDYYNLLTPEQQSSSLNLTGPCYPVLFSSKNLFWSCQLSSSPSDAAIQTWTGLGGAKINTGNFISEAVNKALSGSTAVAKRYVADLGNAWPVLVVCGVIAPFLLSVAWLLLIRYFVGVVAWVTIALFNILMIIVTVFFYIKAGWIGHDAVSAVIGSNAADALPLDASSTEQKHLKIVAVIMTIITVLTILITIVLIRRLVIAIAVMKVAAKSLGAIPTLTIYPIIPFVGTFVFGIYWVVAALYLFSAGTVRQNSCNGGCQAYSLATGTLSSEGCCGYEIHYAKNIGWAIFYHIFGFFWTVQFIIACSLTTIAGAVAAYYWSRGEISVISDFPLLKSAKRVLRYSLGSMALGSLVVAIIEMIRFILEWIRTKLKALEAAPGGCCITILCCCAQCCLGCIEWTVKFINRNAYIVIAVTGTGFCRAAGRATSLIITNILRVGVVNVIGDIMLFIGKITVSLAAAVFAFLMLDQHQFKSGSNKVSSPLFPVLFCWLTGYIVAAMFFAVVEMAIDTILLSFCEDCEENNGTALHAPPLLMDTLNQHKLLSDDIQRQQL